MQESPSARLARLVIERRKELGLDQTDIKRRGGPSHATVGLIERGQAPTLQRGTRAGLEAALEWAPGSIDAIENGDDPVDLYTRNPDGSRGGKVGDDPTFIDWFRQQYPGAEAAPGSTWHRDRGRPDYSGLARNVDRGPVTAGLRASWPKDLPRDDVAQITGALIAYEQQLAAAVDDVRNIQDEQAMLATHAAQAAQVVQELVVLQALLRSQLDQLGIAERATDSPGDSARPYLAARTSDADRIARGELDLAAQTGTIQPSPSLGDQAQAGEENQDPGEAL